MALNQEEISKIAARVAEEVMRQMRGQAARKKVLALLPGYVWDQAGVADTLCGMQADAALFEGAQLPAKPLRQMQIQSREDKQNLVASIMDYEEIVLVTPSLALIHTLARGDDSVFEAMLCLRPLLWGRSVTLLLDFEAPAYRRSTMFAELADALGSLEKAGMQIRTLKQKEAGPDEPKDLVTEKDIKDAAKAEKKSVRTREGAIVTQLARDTAKELGITIEV